LDERKEAIGILDRLPLYGALYKNFLHSSDKRMLDSERVKNVLIYFLEKSTLLNWEWTEVRIDQGLERG
jgi:hypothetical protein